MAGLLPRLQRGVLQGSEQWLYLEPLVQELAHWRHSRYARTSLAKQEREEHSGDLEDESARGLHLLAKQLVTFSGQQVVLLVDQFEELFTQTRLKRSGNTSLTCWSPP